MKKLLIAFAVSAFLLGSCSDDTADEQAKDQISISATEINATPDGQTSSIQVKSSGLWRISGVCDWARPSTLSGNSGTAVEFTVDPNTTGVEREFTFKIFTGSAVAQIKVTSYANEFIELVSDERVQISNTENEFSVKLNTNLKDLTYTYVQEGEEWISFSQHIDAFGPTILRFKALENTGYTSRKAELHITGGSAEPIVIQVEQAQTDHMGVESLSYIFDFSKQTLSFDVESNVEYTVGVSENWIEQVQSRSLDTKTLTFNIQEANTVRTANITLTPQSSTLQPIRIRVVQRDPNAQTANIPDEAFRTKLLNLGMIVEVGEGDCYVTESGLSATTLNISPGYNDPKIVSVVGIELFPNLTTINAYGNKIEAFDISKLTKVTSLNINSNLLSEVRLGDNAINELLLTSLYFYDRTDWSYITPSSFTIESSTLTSLVITVSSYITDSMSFIDVSECPALKTLDARRKTGILKQLYFKNEAQKDQVTSLKYTTGAEILYREN